MTKITIKLDINGQGKIMLDKKDISKYVYDIDFCCNPGSHPRLKLQLMSEDYEIVSEMRNSGIVVDEIRIINPKHL